MLAANKMGGRFNMQALRWASKELRGDKEVVLAAVQQNGQVLPFASKELQKDEEVVLAAVKQREEAREKRST